MKFTFELNGVKAEREIPTDWDQVKYSDFLQLGTTETQALTVFTGFDEDTVKKSTVKNLGKLTAALSFLKSDIRDNITKFPKKILGYQVDQSLDFEPYGVYTDIKDEVDKRKQGMDLLKQYPLLCAIYITKPYDFKKAEQVAEQLLNAPCTEVLALGNFLLLKLIALNSIISPTSLKRLTLLKSLRLVLKGWRARLAFQVRYFIFSRFHRTIPRSN